MLPPRLTGTPAAVALDSRGLLTVPHNGTFTLTTSVR